jgi:uncharacterized protein
MPRLSDIPVADASQEDVLVLLAAGATGPFDFDPIRLMKGTFVVAMRGPQRWRELFHFQPYDYGPFDVDVYRARDELIAKGLLESDDRGAYSRYRLTNSGKQRAAALQEQLPTDVREWMSSVGHYITSRSFSQLLREIYAEFPEFATRSVFSG